MILKHSVEKQLLFDGMEDDLVADPVTLKQFGIDTPVRYVVINNHNLELLRQEIPESDFHYIMRTGSFTLDGNGFIKVYTGSDGLPLYYVKKEKQILVFATGEYQPARYKLYLEGVWEMG
jgi:hypothetical protein